MASRTRFESAGRSDVGRHRQNNEDRFLVDAEHGIFMVVDGVGGHAAGEQAAAIAVDAIHARLTRETGSVDSRIREAITLANNEIFARASAREEWFGMACVLTVAVVDGDQIIVGHVGDTRLYKIQQGSITKITPDHSPVGELEDAGHLSELDAMRHPRRNEVYRDVGTQQHDTHDEGFIQILKTTFEPASALLICSDGLSDLVTAEQIRLTVERNAGDLSAVLDELIESANVASGKDNITVVYIEGESFAKSVNRESPAIRTMAYGQQGIGSAVESDTGRTGFLSRPEPAPAAVRPRNPASAPQYHSAAAPPPPIARPKTTGAGRRFITRLALLVFGMTLGAAILFAAQWFSLVKPFIKDQGKLNKSARAFFVGQGAESEFKTISAALAAAQNDGAEGGRLIEVAPGEYNEHVSLKNGVSLVSRIPGAAVILAPDHGEHAGIAVSADGVETAALAGFKITGNQAHPLSVGLRLKDSSVDISDAEISNAERAGVEITGADRSTVRATYVHSYRDAGIHVGEQAAPRLTRNVITRSQEQETGRKPAIRITENAKPRMEWNTIYETEDVQGLEPVMMIEFRKNNFVISKFKDARGPQVSPTLPQGPPERRW